MFEVFLNDVLTIVHSRGSALFPGHEDVCVQGGSLQPGQVQAKPQQDVLGRKRPSGILLCKKLTSKLFLKINCMFNLLMLLRVKFFCNFAYI